MKTKNIVELAEIVRSKNSGPFELTFDIIFKDYETYYKVKSMGIINKELIAKLYNIDQSQIVVFVEFDAAKAIKATITRPLSSGAVGDSDIYGAQQDAPLLQIEIPWD